jgi:hypothetical protein
MSPGTTRAHYSFRCSRANLSRLQALQRCSYESRTSVSQVSWFRFLLGTSHARSTHMSAVTVFRNCRMRGMRSRMGLNFRFMRSDFHLLRKPTARLSKVRSPPSSLPHPSPHKPKAFSDRV